jgi:hypothetical protein
MFRTAERLKTLAGGQRSATPGSQGQRSATLGNRPRAIANPEGVAQHSSSCFVPGEFQAQRRLASEQDGMRSAQ